MHAMPVEDVDVLLARAGLVDLRLVAALARERKADRIDNVGMAIEDAGRLHRLSVLGGGHVTRFSSSPPANKRPRLAKMAAILWRVP